MYVLCKRLNAPGFKEPVSIVKRSESLDEITNEIKKRVADGCPVRDLSIFEEISYQLKMGVSFVTEDAHERS